jgi:acyl-CoA thioester hydrolase
MDADLAAAEIHAHWSEEKIRFQDIDRLDHVNNIAIATYVETGRIEFLDAVTPGTLRRSDAPFWVIAQLDLRFRAQAHYPGRVRIGTSVLRVGNSSVTLGQGLFDAEGHCIASAESVVVLIDARTGRGVPLPPEARSAMEAHAPRSPSG